VTVWLAVAIAMGMAAYAIYHYATMPGHTALDLLLHHSWHVLVLAAAIYIVSWFAFHQLLVAPLKKIYLHLYAMGAGRLEPLTLNSNVTEIRTIVEGVNLLLFRINQSADSGSLELAQQRIGEIRDVMRRLSPANPQDVSELLDKLAQIESTFAALVQRSNAPASDADAITDTRSVMKSNNPIEV
jgi:hypothetical protein